MSLNPINGPVILVEDDPALREATVQALELSGLQVQPFESAARAARFVIPSFAGCIVTDIRMDGMDGLHLFAKVMEIDREIPVVLITGHGDIGMAVRAMQDGAFDFLAKPFATEHLAAVVRKALQSRHLVLDNRALRNALAAPDEDMVAHSRVMGQLRNMASQVARTAIDVTIEGEAGTGKELLARRIHQQSSRFNRPFHVVSGASISHDIDLNQLIETVNGGTLFLDGGDCLPLSVQTRLVAALDARDRSRGMNDDDNDFRLITSNPIALSEMLQSGSLREDLFHRLNSITLRIPPLRDRRDDIPALFAKFVRDALEQTGKKRFEMNATDRKHLLEHHWPGNARELRNYVFGAVLNLPRPALSPMISSVSKPLSTHVNAFERMIIEETLTKTGGNVVRACKLLATPRKTLYEKFAKYEIQPRDFRLGQKNTAKSI